MHGKNSDDVNIVSYHHFFDNTTMERILNRQKQKNRKWKSGQNQIFFVKFVFVVVIGIIVLLFFKMLLLFYNSSLSLSILSI